MSKTGFLVIGPYPDRDLRHIGGTTILFKNFIDYLDAKFIKHEVITTIKFKGFGCELLNFFYVIFFSLIHIPQNRIIIFNFNKRSVTYLAPLLFLYAKFVKRKIVLRRFGSSACQGLQSANPLLRRMYKSIYRNADLLFFETRAEVDFFRAINKNTKLFSNCRQFENVFRPRNYRKKFVFISQVKVEKGILILLEAFRHLSKDYSLDIYGPVIDKELEYIKKLPCYKGIVHFDEVYDVLNTSDVLVLPTFQKGEGYPGIIIEAYAMSVPVITTRWNAIPDMVEEGVSGFLIEPNSVTALQQAILNLNEINYSQMNAGSYKMAHNFQSNKVHEHIMSIIQEEFKSDFS